MKNSLGRISAVIAFLITMAGCTEAPTPEATVGVDSAAMPAVSTGDIDRSVLPIQPPVRAPITEMDARNVEKPPIFSVKPPEGAPNVVIVLIDDIGFAATTPFGGAIETPTFERLANEGLRFNMFHTTALCSPTRASLLSGRNHHEVNVGSVMEVATGFAGNQGMRPDDVVQNAFLQIHLSAASFDTSRPRPDGHQPRRPVSLEFETFCAATRACLKENPP